MYHISGAFSNRLIAYQVSDMELREDHEVLDRPELPEIQNR